MEPWHLSENFKNVEIKLIFLIKKAVRKWKIIKGVCGKSCAMFFLRKKYNFF